MILSGLSCAIQERPLMSDTATKELQSAEGLIGSPVPLPSYLPSGHKVQRILDPELGDYYIEDYGTVQLWKVTLLISDREIKGHIGREMLEWVNGEIGLFKVAGRRGIQLDLVQWRGHPFSLAALSGIYKPGQKAPPPRELFKGEKGYIELIDGCYRIIWGWPSLD